MLGRCPYCNSVSLRGHSSGMMDLCSSSGRVSYRAGVDENPCWRLIARANRNNTQIEKPPDIICRRIGYSALASRHRGTSSDSSHDLACRKSSYGLPRVKSSQFVRPQDSGRVSCSQHGIRASARPVGRSRGSPSIRPTALTWLFNISSSPVTTRDSTPFAPVFSPQTECPFRHRLGCRRFSARSSRMRPTGYL